MALEQSEKNKHLLWRAGFGASLAELGILTMPGDKLYDKLSQDAEKFEPLKVPGAGDIDVLMDEAMGMQQKKTDPERRAMRRKSADNLKKLNLLWLDTMVTTDAQLREKIALFWHGHFACRNANYYYQEALLNSIRQHALGNFGDLLKAVSTSAAMLQFLNNQQNKKLHPNENFAREVMELFTMGRGNYTEQDIKEAARAFTGWSADLRGEFRFRTQFHDTDSKTILGKTGNFDGDDVLKILLEQKQTARFITAKLYRYFVNERPDEEKINTLADGFYQSNYDIKKLMRDIFTADWFYEDKNVGAIIKSPVQLLVGIRRILPANIQVPAMQLLIERSLGQVLFYPPNVAGWPGGKNWIDSSTLMTRLRIPRMMQHSDVKISAKPDDDVQMGMPNRDTTGSIKKIKEGNMVFAVVNWEKFAAAFKDVPEQLLYNNLHKLVLQSSSKIDIAYAGTAKEKQSKEVYIKSTALALMCTPEYQMC